MLTVLSVMLLTIVVIGATYALFQFSRNGQRTNQVSTASVTMTYTEEQNGLTLSNAMPTTDEVGKMISDSDKVFDFTVAITTTGSENISYEVTAEKQNSSTLQDSDVKLYLVRGTDGTNYNDEVLLPSNYNPMSSSDSFGASAGEMVLDSGVVNTSTTYYYKLRMWVDENYQIDNTVRSYTAKVNAYGKDGEITSSNKVDVRSVKRKTITTNDTIDLDIPNTSGATTWTSSNQGVATVDNDEIVSPVGEGTTTVTGSNGGNTRSITIIITPAPITGKSLTAHIRSLYNNGDTDLIADSDGNIRYTGASPKNYITFNNETWRIIGVFGDNVKIMRNESIGKMSWDLEYSNNWKRPATLRRLLNNDYYNGLGITTSREVSGEASGEFYQTNGLDALSRRMIQNHSWYVGGINSIIATASQLLISEKSDTDIMNVGLPSPSDYEYTLSACYDGSQTLNKYNNGCASSSWMYLNMTNYGQSKAWLLIPYTIGNVSTYRIFYDGSLSFDGVDYVDAVFPTVFLKSSVIITDNTRIGASGSKYTISN